MGRVSCLCGLGLVAGRLWFLVEGLDQGANSRRRVQPLCLLQEAERSVRLVALDGLKGDANTALGFILVGLRKNLMPP